MKISDTQKVENGRVSYPDMEGFYKIVRADLSE